ncbi:MAG: Ig-like domain-containing protein [bacterium]|nr:Ig-like domain-containing protein [bacterium]
MRKTRTLAGCALALCAAACWRAAPEPEAPLTVTRVSPVDEQPLLLNDSVTVYFSDAVDPLSVTTESVAVVGSDGRPVRGSLRTGTNWVTFVPDPPMTATLADGSFRPGERYRLVVAGYPRPDAVRAVDGRRLSETPAREFVMSPAGPVDLPTGRLPAPLRPPNSELPFLQHTTDVLAQVPAGAPRLRLHFTLPVLPTSARPEAFVVRLAHTRQRLDVRRVRVLTTPVDPHPGSTVELDLGTEPRLHGGGPRVTLSAGNLLTVLLATGPDGVRDYSGQEPFPRPITSAPLWQVVHGGSLALVAWPDQDEGIVGDDWLMPGFESQNGIVRPRVRVEAGNGSLGVLRPTSDLTLRPGVAFDRGDGVMVQSVDGKFPFLAIDIPRGVTLRIDSPGPVRLQSVGGIAIAGDLELAAPTATVPTLQHGALASELLAEAPVALVAAGEVRVTGRIVTATTLPSNQTALAIATAARIQLGGELPYNTVLAVERATARSGPAIQGPRGQSLPTAVAFEYGLAAGARFAVRGASPWRLLGRDHDRGVLRFLGASPSLQIRWQTVLADPAEPTAPDLRPDRLPRPESIFDGDWLALRPGSFGRFLVHADLVAGYELPMFEELRLADR